MSWIKNLWRNSAELKRNGMNKFFSFISWYLTFMLISFQLISKLFNFFLFRQKYSAGIFLLDSYSGVIPANKPGKDCFFSLKDLKCMILFWVLKQFFKRKIIYFQCHLRYFYFLNFIFSAVCKQPFHNSI